MSFRQTINDDLCHKLRLVGLTKEETLPIVNSITRSVLAEGPENVVKRLKLLKQAAINHLAGQNIDLPWIAHNKNGPKGPWKCVWKKLASSNHKQQKRALNAMMVYASLVLPKTASPTSNQEKKFLSSVMHSEDELLIRNRGVHIVIRSHEFEVALRRLKNTIGKPRYVGEIPEAAIHLTKLNGADKQGVKKTERNINLCLTNPAFQAFQAFPEVQKALGEAGEDYRELTHPWNGFHRDWNTVNLDDIDGNIGVVGFSQEPGYKFRAFASPNQVLQVSLNALKNYLLNILKSCPWDNTHDQEKGVMVVQEWLKDNKTVYSVDLSDATNNFPLKYQMEVLKSLGVIPESTLRLFKLVCQAPYKLMWGTKELVQWDVGQPLGAGPSFPTFALSHAVLALQAEKLAGISQRDAGSTFLILGDDFVTNHPDVHLHYRKLLATLRCPVSESKCLTSSLAAEFAGKLIKKDYVFHGFKYKEVTDQSFMAVVRTLGKQALSKQLLTEKQYQYAKAVEFVPEPMGLGFNPKGVPYSVRYEFWLHLEEKLQASKRKPSTATEDELRNSFMYNSRQNYLRYFPVVTRPTPKPISKSQDKTVEVMQVMRGSALTSTVVARGDPRPSPTLDIQTKKLVQLKREILELNMREVDNLDTDPITPVKVSSVKRKLK
jgi:hypothetical protein